MLLRPSPFVIPTSGVCHSDRRPFVIPTEGRNLLRAGCTGAASEQQVPHGFAVRNDKGLRRMTKSWGAGQRSGRRARVWVWTAKPLRNLLSCRFPMRLKVAIRTISMS